MRKRVALAMTMVYEPEIVLMDEPFGALDVQTRNLMENDLLEIWAQRRRTVRVRDARSGRSDRALGSRGRHDGVTGAREGGVLDRAAAPPFRDEVRFHPEFGRLYETIWKDLKDEVRIGYERSQKGLAG
jgi:NitT/TauT family transport system ATP-binding protein